MACVEEHLHTFGNSEITTQGIKNVLGEQYTLTFFHSPIFEIHAVYCRPAFSGYHAWSARILAAEIIERKRFMHGGGRTCDACSRHADQEIGLTVRYKQPSYYRVCSGHALCIGSVQLNSPSWRNGTMSNRGRALLLTTGTSSGLSCLLFLCLVIFDGTWGTPYALVLTGSPVVLALNWLCALLSAQINTTSSAQAAVFA